MIVKIASFYVLYFVLSEVLSLININYFNSLNNLYLLFVLFFIYIFQVLLYLIKQSGIFITNKTYDVLIITKEKKVKLHGFYDSGNLMEYLMKPVIAVKSTYFDNSFKKVGEIVIDQIGNKQCLDVYSCNKVLINKVSCDTYIVFLDNIDFDCILNSHHK